MLIRGHRRRSSRAGWVWAVLLMLLGIVFGLGPRLGTFLLVSDEPAPADAVFLTYGVNIRRAALDAAVARYKAGDRPQVLIGALKSRDAAYYITPHTSELARQYLVAGGVPEAAIQVLPSVDSELEEAQRLREAVDGKGWTRVVAYAPDFRSRRTAGGLKKAMAATGVELRVVAVRDPEVRLERWWENSAGINVIYNEYPRLLYYALRGWV